MFCTKCGKPLHDNSAFCAYCGTPTETRLQKDNGGFYHPSGRTEQRQAELDEVKKLIAYFSQKSSVYEQYDQAVQSYYNLLKQAQKNGKNRTIGFINLGISSTLVIFILMMISNYRLEVLCVILGFFAFATAITGIIFMCCVTSTTNAKAFEDRINALSNELYKHYLGYTNCPIGPEYTNPANLDAIYQTILSGRADTTKEAINILVEDAHRSRMEDIAAQTAIYAEQAAVQAGRAASSARIGAFFSAANYFQVNRYINR